MVGCGFLRPFAIFWLGNAGGGRIEPIIDSDYSCNIMWFDCMVFESDFGLSTLRCKPEVSKPSLLE